MPDQTQYQQSTSHQEKELNPLNKSPAIRTMESDAAEFLKRKPALAKILSEELKRPETQEGSLKPRARSRYMLLTVVVGLVLILLSGAAWRLFFAQVPPETPPPKLTPPPPLFAVEASRTIAPNSANRPEFLRLMADSAAEPERQGIFKRIIIKLRDGPEERFATLADFFDLYRIIYPREILRSIDAIPMNFVYYSSAGPRLGLALRTRDSSRILADLLLWEKTMPADLRPLLLGEEVGPVVAISFEDRTYRNIDWRFLKLSKEKDLGLGYFVFPARNIAVLTTSKEAIERTIERLLPQ